MSQSSSNSPPLLGTFLWHEVMSQDPAGTRAFYTQILGWTVAPMPNAPDPEHYAVFSARGTGVAGVMRLPEQAAAMGAPSHWLGYLGSPNVKATVDQVVALGGSVRMPPTAIAGVGTIAVLADAQGAGFGLLQPESGLPDNMLQSDGNPNGTVTWHELVTSDLEAAWTFYSTAFGWQLVEDMDMGPSGKYRLFSTGGEPIGGLTNLPPQCTGSAWTHYLQVPDLQAAIDKSIELGAKLERGPETVAGGDRIALLVDPQGAFFALHTFPAKK